MSFIRKYGIEPIDVVLVHGGPGAAGEMATIANEISYKHGVIEPLQNQETIRGQIDELKDTIINSCTPPVKLVGHSWGAWLAFLFASEYPELTKKLILICAGSFLDSYNTDMAKIRTDRLTKSEQSEVNRILLSINQSGTNAKIQAFKRMGEIMSKADSYKLLPAEDEHIEYNPEIFQSVWKEASELRRNCSLLNAGLKIKCPVVAIHGNYDPHPASGVEEPLSKVLKDFRFVLIDKCGHYPWKEKYAKSKFYNFLEKELS